MQDRYCEIIEFETIPTRDKRFTITQEGEVFDNLLGKPVKVVVSQNGESTVLICDEHGWFSAKIAVLLAIVTKRVRIPSLLWRKIDVMYVDSDPVNFQPANTVWKYPKDGLKIDEKSDFCYIPGFSRYSVNKSGKIFSLATQKFLSPYQDEMGYWMYGVTPDVGKRTMVGMHRAIALAFLDYPAEVDRLDVNHFNGIKSDNAIDNLEWARRKRNCDHAYETGLRTDNIVVDVRNAFTGELCTYYSLEECARQLGVDGETIRLRVKSTGEKVYAPGYQFKAHSDPTPWCEYQDPLAKMRADRMSIPVRATHRKTGERFDFKTSSHLSSLLGITTSGVHWHLKGMANDKTIGDYRIEYLTLANS